MSSAQTLLLPAHPPEPFAALHNHTAAGLTVRDVAHRYRVGQDKVRRWIRRGELRAINTAAALCGRPRWVVPPEALAEFENGRRGGPAPKTCLRRRKTQAIDYYP
jgi:excisionase family DNA binding protein